MKKLLIAFAAAALAASSFGQGAAKHPRGHAAAAKRTVASAKKAPASKRGKNLNPTKIAPSAKLPHRLPKHGAD